MRKIIFLLLSLGLVPALYAQTNISNSNSAASRVVTTTTVTTSTSANKVTSGVVTTTPATTIDKEGVTSLVSTTKAQQSKQTRSRQARQPCPKQFVCPSNAEFEKKFDDFVAAYNKDQEEEEKERKASATFREQWDNFQIGWTTWKTSVDGSIARFTADTGANAYQVAWINWLFWWGVIIVLFLLFLWLVIWAIRAIIRLVRPPDYAVYDRRELPV